MARKLKCILLSFVLCLCVLPTSSLAVSDTEDTISPYSLWTYPTEYWSLSEESYTAEFEVLGSGALFTNYYFRPNGEGEIHIDYQLATETGTTTVEVGCIDMDKNDVVSTFKTGAFGTSGVYSGIRFSGLTISHKYCFVFKSNDQVVTGTALIYH